MSPIDGNDWDGGDVSFKRAMRCSLSSSSFASVDIFGTHKIGSTIKEGGMVH